MLWSHIAQAGNDLLSIVLLVRLVTLRLHIQIVYRLFCGFIGLQLLGSLVEVIEQVTPRHHPDYRVTWISLQVLLWVLSLWIVYALLTDVLHGLPGILTFSRKLLNITFLAAVVFALWSAKAEYASSNAASLTTRMARAVGITVLMNRAICTAALIALLAILCFVLWFPVQMPKNLARFSVGFAIYFAATTVSLLAWSLWSMASYRLVDNLTMLVLTMCYAYWAIFITSEGESAAVRLGHSWQVSEQQRLIAQLEAMNASLLRAARR